MKGTVFRMVCVASMLFIAEAGVSSASGTPLTFHFEGYIDFVHSSLELDDSIGANVPFFGSYGFDPTGINDQYPDNPTVGLYLFGPGARISVQIGNYQFVSGDLGMLIWNDRISGDLYEASSVSPFEAAGIQWSFMNIVLGDRMRRALDSDALVTTVPDLSDFPDGQTLFLDLPGDTTGIRGTLTSLTPEPSSLLLAFPCAAALVARRRRG